MLRGNVFLSGVFVRFCLEYLVWLWCFFFVINCKDIDIVICKRILKYVRLILYKIVGVKYKIICDYFVYVFCKEILYIM